MGGSAVVSEGGEESVAGKEIVGAGEGEIVFVGWTIARADGVLNGDVVIAVTADVDAGIGECGVSREGGVIDGKGAV